MSNQRDIVERLQERASNPFPATITIDRDGSWHDSPMLNEAAAEITRLRGELAAEREAVRVLAYGYVQCRGALILDHMLDANGNMYGTTNCAIEYGSVVNSNLIASAAIQRAKQKGSE